MFMSYVFFFVKQKTAYEMRISDWSSDVCSSDLYCAIAPRRLTSARQPLYRCPWPNRSPFMSIGRFACRNAPIATSTAMCASASIRRRGARPCSRICGTRRICCPAARSEEHTSELQSLMRNSYAVFCLKKQTLHGNDRDKTLFLMNSNNLFAHSDTH